MLPIVHPQRYIKTLGTGANLPILISGIEETENNEDDYVVKLMAGERMDESACFRELLACLLAKEMDIPIVEPAVINITADFVDSVIGTDCHRRVAESLGFNFGSKYLSKYQILLRDQPLNDTQIEYAHDVFWFDMLIQNPDRTYLKPNMFTNGKNIVIFDHELSFSFLMLIGGDAEPWNVTNNKWPNFDNLILPKKLKSINFDEERIVYKLNKINVAFWNQTAALMPAKWMNQSYLDRVKRHVKLIQDHSHEFVLSLNNMINFDENTDIDNLPF